MASYIELIAASNDSTLRQKIAVACVVAAETIRVESVDTPNHANRLLWAKRVYASPTVAAADMVWPVLAQNKMVANSTLLTASDSAIQTAVDAAVSVFV